MQSLPVGKIDDCGNETGEIQMEKVSVRLSLRASPTNLCCLRRLCLWPEIRVDARCMGILLNYQLRSDRSRWC